MRLNGGAELVEPPAPARGQVLLVDVRRVQDRLRREQAELAQEPDRRLALTGLARAAARVELRHHALEYHQLRLRSLVAGARGLAGLVEPPLHHREIGQGELAR